MGVKTIFLTAFLFAVTNCHALSGSESKVDELIGELQKNINLSTLALSEKIKVCDKERENDVPLLNNTKDFDESKRRQILTGLAYLNNRNMSNCVSEAKMKLAFDLGTLRQVRLHYKLDINDISEVESNLIYPSIKDLELANKYKKLPLELIRYLERVVGESPFDLLGAMNQNNLNLVK